MRSLTRIEWSLITAAVLFVSAVVLVSVLGEERRRRSSVCLNCGVTQYAVYTVVRLFGRDWWLPNGTATSGGARADCPHQIKRFDEAP